MSVDRLLRLLRTFGWFSLAWLVSALAGLAAPVPAASDATRWVHFTTTSGLPSAVVLSINDFPDRGVWAATSSGLATFDGFRWRPVPIDGVRNVPAGGLALDASHRVVALTGGRLVTGDADGLRTVPASNGINTLKFTAAAQAATGPVLLLGDDRRVYEWDGRTVRRHVPSEYLGKVPHLLSGTPSGAWASTERGLYRWDGRAWRLQLKSSGPVFEVMGLAEDRDQRGAAYVESPAAARGLWEWPDRNATRAVHREQATQVTSIALFPKAELVAVLQTGEIMTKDGESWNPLTADGPRLLDARRCGYLANGDLWVATDHGLYVRRTAAGRFRTAAIPYPDDRNSINDIARMPDGSLMLGTSNGLVEFRPGGSFPTNPPPLEHQAVTGVAVDAQGRVWAVSGRSFSGVRRRNAAGTWEKVALDPKLDRAFIHQIAKDRTGHLWFLGLSENTGFPIDGTADAPGAFRLGDDDRVENWGPARGLPSGRVYAFVESRDGAYWFGTGVGLSRWLHNRWTHWSVVNGLRDHGVFTVAEDANGTIWFGDRMEGIEHLENDKPVHTTIEGGTARSVWDLHTDDHGRMWVGGDGGLAYLDKTGWTTFDESSGMPSTRVWPVFAIGNHVFAGTRGRGLAELDLEQAAAPPPVVVFDQPTVDGQKVVVRWRAFAWWGESPPESVLTRVRLDGLPWSEWTTDRERSFNDVSPGQHRVTAESKGLHGTRNGSVPALVFKVADVPVPLWRRPAFVFPIGALALVVAGLAGVMAVRQRRHHREIHLREQQFARTFQSSPLPASISRVSDGTFLDVNTAFVELSGYSIEELRGKHAFDLGLLPGNSGRKELQTAMENGRRLIAIPLTVQIRSGRILETLSYFEPIEFGSEKAILAQFLDLTEQRRLEAALGQAQKMESVGRLAGGIAHDFNNLLTVIIGNAAILDKELPFNDPRRAELEQIKVAGDRAGALTRQLLVFARKQIVEPRVIDINELVLRTDRLLRRLIGEHIELVTLPGSPVERVLVDPHQLEQVIINLAVNARDAMPSGGTLTIATSMADVTVQDAQRFPEAVPGRYVRLTVADTGTGMGDATLSKLFEPFFTTKEPGKGTGLGLASCYGAAKQAGGHILVESAIGEGSRFHVDLPPVKAPTVTEAVERPLESPGGAETVMVVEDEVQVRGLTATILRRYGYHVIECDSGYQALRLATDSSDRIDLLITDIVMPLMRGTELAVRMRGPRPDIKVLFMSGYTDQEMFEHETGCKPAFFVAKPYTPPTLARKVRDVLDGPERRPAQ
jgi:PAS domain S-box-containing protein